MSGLPYNVSYAQWTNPFTGTSTGGRAYYATSAQQPIVRRLVPQPTAKFTYPGVSYGYADTKEEEGGEESGKNTCLFLSPFS